MKKQPKKEVEIEESGAESIIAAPAPEIFYTHELVCGFCGTKTGEMQVPLDKVGDVAPTNAELGIDDIRCDKCAKKHGQHEGSSAAATHE